jgi:hypothetical protein
MVIHEDGHPEMKRKRPFSPLPGAYISSQASANAVKDDCQRPTSPRSRFATMTDGKESPIEVYERLKELSCNNMGRHNRKRAQLVKRTPKRYQHEELGFHIRIDELLIEVEPEPLDPDGEYKLTDEDLTCPICLNQFVYPITLRCQHSFCRVCIAMAVSRTESCPMCRAYQTKYDIFQHSVDKILAKLTPITAAKLVEVHEEEEYDTRYNEHYWELTRAHLELNHSRTARNTLQDLKRIAEEEEDNWPLTLCPSPISCVCCFLSFVSFTVFSTVLLEQFGKDFRHYQKLHGNMTVTGYYSHSPSLHHEWFRNTVETCFNMTTEAVINVTKTSLMNF